MYMHTNYIPLKRDLDTEINAYAKNIRTYIYIDRYVCMYAYIDLGIAVYVCIYIEREGLYIHIYVCVYICL